MQTMEMGSAEAALTQMASIPSAGSSSYFLQLDPSGRVDILDSSLVLSKPDLGDETVYEIQLDSYMVDERNVEIVNLQNLPNSVTFPPEFLDHPFSTGTFEPQVHYQLDDVNFCQILSNHATEIVEDVVPDYTVETEVATELEAEPAIINPHVFHENYLPSDSMQIETAVVQDNHTNLSSFVSDLFHNSVNCPSDGLSTSISNVHQSLKNEELLEFLHETATDVDCGKAFPKSDDASSSESKATVDSPQEKSETLINAEKDTEKYEFTEEAVMPPVVEIIPTNYKSTTCAQLTPPVITIYEEDDEKTSCKHGKTPIRPTFLHENMDPDDELYISYYSRPDSTKTTLCILCYKWFDTLLDLTNHLTTVHQDNMKLYGCKTCGKEFWSRFLRQRHEKQHRFDLKGPIQRYLPKGRPFDHYVSNHYYKRLRPAPITESYREHIRLIHSQIKSTEYDCIQCDKNFQTEEEYREHYDEEHALQTCLHCRKIFENAKHLREHEQEIHGLYTVKKNLPGGAWKLWETWDCDEMKERDERLINISLYHNYSRRKRAEEHAGKDFSECEEITVTEYEATKTIEKRKPSEKTHSSSKSDKKDSSSANPDVPKLRKTDLKSSSSKLQDYDKIVFLEEENDSEDDSVNRQEDLPFKCEACRTSFDNDADLQRHIKSHQIRSMAYMCQYCGRGFATHSNRKEHERIHTGDKPYVCPICNRAFVQISNLKKHIQTHKDKNNLQCSTCGKQFVKESSLILHQRAHSQDRKFRCHICDRAYNYASLLKRHMRIHTGENPYSCEDCGQQFHELVSLHYHRKKVHTGERPHRCDTCGRAFILSSDLKKHLKIHLRDAGGLKPRTDSGAAGGKSNSLEPIKTSKKGSPKKVTTTAPTFEMEDDLEPISESRQLTEVITDGQSNTEEKDEPEPEDVISDDERLVISETDLLNTIENELHDDGKVELSQEQITDNGAGITEIDADSVS